jgi:4-hydroxythreonine-4-phosphate dehydrogenase
MRRGTRIGVTFGDLAGVGPEIIAKTLVRKWPGVRFVLFGDPAAFDEACRLPGMRPLGASFRFAFEAFPGRVPAPRKIVFRKRDRGRIDRRFGALAVRWIREAADEAASGTLDAVVTAPIHKEACRRSGFAFRGHTDFLAHLCGDPPHRMAFASNRLRLVLDSHHLSLKEAVHGLRAPRLSETLVLGHAFMRSLGVLRPRILVAGLNPHAGEGGAFGDEETLIVRPAILDARRRGVDAEGPFPPDTVFRKAIGHPRTLVAALYHDQGLIPFKLVAFDTGVNVTAGLPWVRTSPDHGTAMDVAWRGEASERSRVRAVRLALRMVKSRSSAPASRRRVRRS